MKDRYQVSGSSPIREDDSFKMCICTLLIFLALLAMISIALFMKTGPDKEPIKDGPQIDRWGGKVDQTSTTKLTSTEPSTAVKLTESTTLTTRIPKSTKKMLILQTSSTKNETEYTTSRTSTPTTTGEPLAMSSTVNKNKPFTFTSTYITDKHTTTKPPATETEIKTVTSITDTSTTDNFLSNQTLVTDIETTSERFTEVISNEDDSLIGSSFSNVNENETKSMDFETTATSADVGLVYTTQRDMIETKSKITTTEYYEDVITGRTKSEPESDDLRLNTSTENSVGESIKTTKPKELGLSSKTFTTEGILTTLEKENASESGTNATMPILEDTNTVGTHIAERLMLATSSTNDNTATTGSSCPVCPACTTAAMAVTSVSTTPKPMESVCQTRQCHAVASRMLSLADLDVDPCDDFYSYACGGIADNPTLLEQDPSADVWHRIYKSVKSVSTASPPPYQWFRNYYDGCVNYDKLVSKQQRKQEGRRWLESVGSFLENSDDIPEGAFTDISLAHLKLRSLPLFSVWLDVDSVNSSRFQVVVGPPHSLGPHPLDAGDQESDRCKYKADDKIPNNLAAAWATYQNCKKNFSEYIETTAKALEFFGVFEDKGETNASDFIQEICISVEDVLNLLQLNYSDPGLIKHKIETKARVEPFFKQVDMQQLQEDISVINWSLLLSGLLPTHVEDTAYIQVYFLDEIKTVFSNLESQVGEGRKVVNSLLAMLAHDLYVRMARTRLSCERERYCLRVASELMPVIASNMYLTQFTTNETAQLHGQTQKVYGELVQELTVSLNSADWLDNSSRAMVLEKLNSSRLELPSVVGDSLLDASMAECNITKNYMKDTVCLLNQFEHISFSRYTLPPLSTIWPHFSTAFSTETTFIYALNTFMVPPAAVSPVYDADMPRHVVLARLGNVLARGIAHNFDSTGVWFKADGRLGKMLSEDASPSFRIAVRTSNEQYQYQKSLQEGGVTYTYSLKAEMTLDQRLSDVTAVNLSLSLLSGAVSDYKLPWVPFTPDQVYFLALAQDFCSKKKMPELFSSLYEDTSLIPSLRVANLASNSEKFALAFKCRLGSNMNGAIKASALPFYEKTDFAYMYSDY